MKSRREKSAEPIPMPVSLEQLTRGYTWARDMVGESGGGVYRLYRAGEPDLYLKHGHGEVADDVVAEMGRLRWLSGRVPVPQVRHFAAGAEEAWLLMTAIPGRSAFACLTSGSAAARLSVVQALAHFLLEFHRQPVEECPFNSAHGVRLAHAHRRLEAGKIDTSDFGERHKGWTADEVWKEMLSLLPMNPDLVVTHGDFSLDNVFMREDGGAVTGCLDVGLAGLADRYQDLTILANCLGDFGEELVGELFRAYGISDPDERKLRFHLALDECF